MKLRNVVICIHMPLLADCLYMYPIDRCFTANEAIALVQARGFVADFADYDDGDDSDCAPFVVQAYLPQ